MKEVRWTETAKQTLRETSRFILELHNPQINEKFLDQLEYKVRQLQIFPQLGSIFGNSQNRKLIIHKTVSLYYVNNQNVGNMGQ